MTSHALLSKLGDVPNVQSSQVSLEVVDPPDQAYMVSICQLESHPSSSNRFPSSHASLACLSPSPQFTTQAVLSSLGESPSVHRVHVSGLLTVPPEHTYMFSMLQLASQPFPTPPAPASHSSVACFIPSPQTAIHSEDSVFG